MSGTPRTDRLIDMIVAGIPCETLDEHAKRLETELVAEMNRFQDTADQLIRTSNERDALRAFAQDILRESRTSLGPGDIGGDFIQESAFKHGLLEKRTVTEPCCDNCPCADVGNFPTQCYFETAIVEPQ